MQLALENKTVVNSLEIAEATGKLHKNIIADIEKMFEDLEIDSADFSAQYKDPSGKANKCYNLDEEMSMTLVSGYNVKLRNALVKVWQEKKRNLDTPKTYSQALLEAGKIQLALETAENKLAQQTPKVQYFDALIDKGLNVPITTCALELGTNCADLTAFLIAKKFCYRKPNYEDSQGKMRLGKVWPSKAYYQESNPNQLYFVLKDFQYKGVTGVRLLVTPRGKQAFKLLLSINN
jgi:phage regulator Rha-like protein